MKLNDYAATDAVEGGPDGFKEEPTQNASAAFVTTGTVAVATATDFVATSDAAAVNDDHTVLIMDSAAGTN